MNKPRFTIAGIGEVLWDVFPDGPRFGGAPANFACCARQLDASHSDVYVMSAVGHDSLGDQAIAELTTRGVDAELIQRNDRETGQVIVQLDDSKKASYRFIADPAWDHIAWQENGAVLASRTDAVCFGTLGQRSPTSRSAIRNFLKSCPAATWKVLDLNLRPPFDFPELIFDSLPLANALKLNDEELPKLAALLDLTGSQREQMEQLQHRFQYRFVALTLGSHGSALLAEEYETLPAEKVKVIDTVGAGDAFTAALVHGALYEKPWNEVHRHASQVAGYVASQSGATPALPNSLRS